MAASSILPTLTSTSSAQRPRQLARAQSSLSPFTLSLTTSTKPVKSLSSKPQNQCLLVAKAQTFDFPSSFFEDTTEQVSEEFGEGGFGGDGPPTAPDFGFTSLEDKEEPQCPPGLRHYETMAVLRPDMSEDERLALTQKYEELLVAGGGMYVEVFNRGVLPLAYSISRRNRDGEKNTYLDGIYLLFTYFTKPESLEILQETMNTDDNIIRSTSFKIRKRKLF